MLLTNVFKEFVNNIIILEQPIKNLKTLLNPHTNTRSTGAAVLSRKYFFFLRILYRFFGEISLLGQSFSKTFGINELGRCTIYLFRIAFTYQVS